MTRRRLVLSLASTLAALVLLSACAAVGGSGTGMSAPFGPALGPVEILPLTAPQVVNEMAWAADRAEPEQAAAASSLSVALEVQSQIQAAMMMEAEAFGCRLGH